MRDDSVDLLRMINVVYSDSKLSQSIRSMQVDELEDLELQRIRRVSRSLGKVCFFIPTEGFEGNFGSLSAELENRGYECLWLFGNAPSYLKSVNKNKFLIINDMCRRISGVDVIITANVMDCLPPNVLHILHDHLSFAHFDLEEKIATLLKTTDLCATRFNSLREVFSELSAFVAFLPFYDLVLTSSEPVTELTLKALRLSGYRGDLDSMAGANVIDSNKISHLIDVCKYRDSIEVFKSGYCKLDAPINKFGNVAADKVIVFAPTPNDVSGNKDNPLWKTAMTVNRYSVDLLIALCVHFQDYKIVFKPYKDELPEVVSNILNRLSEYINFEIDECGSDYWPLYSRAKILISDFSSTAYTFALGIGRPVVFFSPNEAMLSDSVQGSTYCRNRERVGVVATTTDQVVDSVGHLIDQYDQFLSRVSDFRKRNFVQPGRASAAAADAIVHTLTNLKRGEMHRSTVGGVRVARQPT